MPKVRYRVEDMSDGTALFPREVTWLMKKHKCSRQEIEIDINHPCGEDVIFVRGKWEGYIDEAFYKEMYADK